MWLRPALLGHGLAFLIAAVLAFILESNATSLSDQANIVPSTAYDFINAYNCDSGLAPNRTDGTRAQADSDEAFNICQTLLIDKAAKLNFKQRAQDSKNQATGAAGLAAVTAVSSLIAVAAVAAERQRGRPRRTADR